MSATSVIVVTIGPSLRPWLGGAFAYCVLVGLLLGSVDSLVGSGGTADLVEKLGRGTDLADALVNTVLGIVGVVAAAAAVAVIGSLRSDDRAGRGEVVLATAVSPTRRLGATTVLAAFAAVVAPVLAACGLTIGRLIASADGPSVGSTVVAALAGVPASLAVASVGVAAYGFGPRWAAVGWIAVVGDLLLGPLGALLGAPGWLRDLAPHTHLAAVVGQPVPVVPVVICVVAATGATAIGAVALRRRDQT